MDEFIAWIQQILKTGRQLAAETFEALFKSKLVKQRIKKLGYTPTSVNGNAVTLCPI